MSVRPARRVEDLERTLIRRIFDQAPPDAINLGLGQPDLETPEAIAKAGIEGIRSGRTGYTSTAGDPELREAVARRYAPFAAGPESVVVTCGSQEAMFAALMCLADPGDEVLYPDPGYPAYAVVARLQGSVPVPYALREERAFRVDPGDVVARITARTRAVILCSPSNPTGAVNTADDLAELVAVLESRGVAWVSDEVYGGLAYDGPLPSPRTASAEGGVVISGLSKDFSMTGWRLGWVIAPRGIAPRITAVHQYLVTCAPSISQRAALAAFDARASGAVDEHLAIFRRRRDLMGTELSRIAGIRFRPPDGAFYFFVDVNAFGSSVETARRILERRKVVTIPGEAFGERGRGYLRISFAAAEDDIVRGVRAIGQELAEIGAGRPARREPPS